jgi:hypothetical protein
MTGITITRDGIKRNYSLNFVKIDFKLKLLYFEFEITPAIKNFWSAHGFNISGELSEELYESGITERKAYELLCDNLDISYKVIDKNISSDTISIIEINKKNEVYHELEIQLDDMKRDLTDEQLQRTFSAFYDELKYREITTELKDDSLTFTKKEDSLMSETEK